MDTELGVFNVHIPQSSNANNIFASGVYLSAYGNILNIPIIGNDDFGVLIVFGNHNGNFAAQIFIGTRADNFACSFRSWTGTSWFSWKRLDS